MRSGGIKESYLFLFLCYKEIYFVFGYSFYRVRFGSVSYWLLVGGFVFIDSE